MAAHRKIYEAIRTALLNNTAVTALVSTRIYTDWRPGPATTFPRVHLYINGETPLGDWDLAQRFDIQVSAFASDRDLGTAADICRTVRDALAAATLSFTGWTYYTLNREGGRAVGIDDDDIAHWADDYTLILS